MSEELLVRNCAPTLAGIKTGNMFTCPFQSKAALLDSIRSVNRKLGPKGLRLLPLRFSEDKALLYLYRPAMLRQDITAADAAALLECRGYRTESCERCVGHLAKKLRSQKDFPHEVGLFLGYPPEDVHGFIENKACACKCVGCWKVYGNEDAARKKFAQYKKCTRVYRDCWERKGDLDRLAVPNRMQS